MKSEKITTHDESRGKRFAEIVEKLFPNLPSRNARAKEIGFDERNFRAWEMGANINNQMIAELARRGVNLNFLFLGIGDPLNNESAPRPTGGAAVEVGVNADLVAEAHVRFAKLVQLLAEHHAREIRDPDLLPVWLQLLRDIEGSLKEQKQRA